MEKDPYKRLVGTDSLTSSYRDDTPGQRMKNVKKISSQVNEVKVNDLAYGKFTEELGVKGIVSKVTKKHVWIEQDTGLQSTIKTRNFKFVKENVKQVKSSNLTKKKLEKIKNTVLIHPHKKHTEFNVARDVRENKIQFAQSSRNIYDEKKREEQLMAEHNRGGGKKREGLESDSVNHIINQLRIVNDLHDPEGTPVTFNDKTVCLVDHSYAKQALTLYEKFERPAQKEAIAQKLASSPRSFMNTIRTSDEHILSQLEEFIKCRKKGKKITLAERVEPALSNHRLSKVTLEDNGAFWVSKLHYSHQDEVFSTAHVKDEGVVGLNKVRQHLQENIANYYNIPFEDNT